MWSEGRIIQLKSPPIIIVFGCKGGREDQKACWRLDRAGAYILRIIIVESLGWEMETSITRVSGEMLSREDVNWGEMRMAVCLEI